MGPHRHCYLYSQVGVGWQDGAPQRVECGGRHSAGRIQHSGRWNPTGTATYTHRWVKGVDSPGTATYTHRRVVGGMVLEGYNIVGDGTPQALLPILTGGWRVVGGMVLEGYNIVGDETPQALLPILTGGWRVGRHRHCYLYSQVGERWWDRTPQALIPTLTLEGIKVRSLKGCVLQGII